MPYLSVQGKTAFYREQGQGEKALLFLHGAGGNSLHWMAVEAPAGWRVLSLDLPGHGQTQGLARKSVYEYAEWVIEFLEILGERPVLAGHSMGGAIAMSVALFRPDAISGLVLVGTGAKLSVAPQIIEICQAGDTAKVEKLMGEWAYGPAPGREQIADWYRQFGSAGCDVYLADFTACNNFDIREKLSGIRVPALIVCGSIDRLTPVKYSKYLADNLAGSELVEIPDAGHMVMLEQPGYFNAAVADFCKEQ